MVPQAQQDFGGILAQLPNSSDPTAATVSNMGGNLSSAQNVINQANQTPTAPAAPAAKQGSWWDRILPTAGGILGGIGGGLLGGAIDVGTLGAAAPLINPLTLGTLGAGLGGAAGKSGEDVLTGQSADKGVLASGLENAGGNLLGGALGKGISAVAGGVSDMAGRAAVDALMGQAPGVLDRDTAQYLIDNGVTNLSKISKIAPQITGEAGGEGAAFTNGVQNAVDNSADKISIKGAMDNMQDPLNLSTMNDNTAKNGAQAIQRSIDNMVKDSGGTIENQGKSGVTGKQLSDFSGIYEHGQMDNISRGAAYNQAKTFLKAANQIMAKAPKDMMTGNIADPQQAALYNVYNKWGHDLESSALGLGESDTPLPITDEDKQTLKDGIQAIQKSNPSLYETLSNQIDEAQDWKGIKSAQAPLVKASQAANVAAGKLNSVPRTTPLESASQGKMGVLRSIVGSPTTKKVETSTYYNLSKLLGSNKANNLISTLTKIGGIGGANILGGGLNPKPRTSVSPSVNANMGAGANMDSSPVIQALQEAMSSPLMFNQIGNILPMAQKQIEAQNLVNQLTQMYGMAGGAQGMGGGLLTRLSALMPGSAAGQYMRAQPALANTLSGLTGATPSSMASLMPTFTQTPQTANQNLSTLSGLFNAPQGTSF